MTWRERWEAIQDWLTVAWLAVVEFAQWLRDLSSVNWVTWITHSIIAIPVGFTGATSFLVFLYIGFPSVMAAGLSANLTFWLWRESEQVAHRIMASIPLDTLDHLLDVISPSVSLPLLAWWWLR